MKSADWSSPGGQFCLSGVIVDFDHKVVANGHTALLVWYWIVEHDPSVVSFCEVVVNPRSFVSRKIIAGSNRLFSGQSERLLLCERSAGCQQRGAKAQSK